MKFISADIQTINCVQDLEKKLGNPDNKSNLFSFESSLYHDENAAYPQKSCNALNALKIQQMFVPAEYGGTLITFDLMMLCYRSIYRRDPALALGYGMTTFMAAIHIWVAGAESQKQRLAELITRGETIAVAYHEHQNGNDLMAAALSASYKNGYYWLNGSKWIINNIKECAAITLFAKTELLPGARSYSLFFIEKSASPPQAINYSHKVATVGVKACRIAGINFCDYPVPSKNIIKQAGSGFELTAKSFQITRALLPGMSIGAADTALRAALRYFYANKQQQPIYAELIADCFLELLICDVLAAAAARSIHVFSQQLSIIAAITKYYIPKTIQKLLQQIMLIIGVDVIPRNGEYAIIQKLLRDYPVVSLGHSSDVICLNTLLQQTNQLLSTNKVSNNYAQKIALAFNFAAALPKYNLQDLKITNAGYLDILKSLTLPLDVINHSFCFESEKAFNYELISASINQQMQAIKLAAKNVLPDTPSFSTETYLLLDNYARCYAMACCLWFYVFNEQYEFSIINSQSLLLIFEKLFDKKILTFEERKKEQRRLWRLINQQYQHGRAFSVFPIQYQCKESI